MFTVVNETSAANAVDLHFVITDAQKIYARTAVVFPYVSTTAGVAVVKIVKEVRFANMISIAALAVNVMQVNYVPIIGFVANAENAMVVASVFTNANEVDVKIVKGGLFVFTTDAEAGVQIVMETNGVITNV